jgi:hypothetical protein
MVGRVGHLWNYPIFKRNILRVDENTKSTSLLRQVGHISAASLSSYIKTLGK